MAWLTVESLCLHGRALERGIQRSEVRILILLILANIQILNLFLPVPVIHEDEPRKTNATRRATWDGSRDSSTVVQLLSSSKGLHGYGSSGWFCKSLPSLHNNMVIRC